MKKSESSKKRKPSYKKPRKICQPKLSQSLKIQFLSIFLCMIKLNLALIRTI